MTIPLHKTEECRIQTAFGEMDGRHMGCAATRPSRTRRTSLRARARARAVDSATGSRRGSTLDLGNITSPGVNDRRVTSRGVFLEKRTRESTSIYIDTHIIQINIYRRTLSRAPLTEDKEKKIKYVNNKPRPDPYITTENLSPWPVSGAAENIKTGFFFYFFSPRV